MLWSRTSCESSQGTGAKVKDLIESRYFVHDGFAGVSAFANSPAPEQDRNALLVAVGVLVPLGAGRLGKCWRHAERLKGFAR